MLHRLLQREGFDVDRAFTGPDGLRRAQGFRYSCIILDLTLPDMDGLEVCRRLRNEGCGTPILMLTARTEITDRVEGLDGGADDYLGKPFAPPELLARLRALVRRAPEELHPVRTGGLQLDSDARAVVHEGRRVELGPTEYELLRYFVGRAGETLSRTQLLAGVWGYEYSSNIVDVYVAYLREKVLRRLPIGSIETVRGVGYRFAPACESLRELAPAEPVRPAE